MHQQHMACQTAADMSPVPAPSRGRRLARQQQLRVPCAHRTCRTMVVPGWNTCSSKASSSVSFSSRDSGARMGTASVGRHHSFAGHAAGRLERWLWLTLGAVHRRRGYSMPASHAKPRLCVLTEQAAWAAHQS